MENLIAEFERNTQQGIMRPLPTAKHPGQQLTATDRLVIATCRRFAAWNFTTDDLAAIHADMSGCIDPPVTRERLADAVLARMTVETTELIGIIRRLTEEDL